MQTLPKQDCSVNFNDRSSHGSSTYRHVSGDADETTITIDHTTRTAAIWTMRRSIATRLRRLGATQENKAGPGVWLRIHAAAIRFKNPRKKSVSEATRARLVSMADAARG